MAAQQSDSRAAFLQHAARAGYELKGEGRTATQKFRSLIGEARFRQYQALIQAVERGESSNPVYDFPQTLREANLLRSFAGSTAVDPGYRLYELALPHLHEGVRVLELGTWTGLLASFVAIHHPRVTVVGVDRVAHILEAARSHYSLSNLTFVPWDYQQPKPAGLQPADLLLCALGTDRAITGQYLQYSPGSFRHAPAYEDERHEAVSYLKRWREAAREGAILLAALNLTTFPRFLAFVDAACDCDWNPILERTTFLERRESAATPLPILICAAASSARRSEEAVLAHWVRMSTKGHLLAELRGGSGLALYRTLTNRVVLKQTEIISEGKYGGVREIGTLGSVGYVFEFDTFPQCRLLLTTLEYVQREQQTVV